MNTDRGNNEPPETPPPDSHSEDEGKKAESSSSQESAETSSQPASQEDSTEATGDEHEASQDPDPAEVASSGTQNDLEAEFPIDDPNDTIPLPNYETLVAEGTPPQGASARVIQKHIEHLERSLEKYENDRNKASLGGDHRRATLCEIEIEEHKRDINKLQQDLDDIQKRQHAAASTFDRDTPPDISLDAWYRELCPLIQHVVILMGMFQEVQSSLIDRLIERARPLKPPPEASDQENGAPPTTHTTVSDILEIAGARLDFRDDGAYVFYPRDSKRYTEILTYLREKRYFELTEAAVDLVEYTASDTLTKEERWSCARAIARALPNSAHQLLRRIVAKWVLVDPLESGASHRQALLGHVIRQVLEDDPDTNAPVVEEWISWLQSDRDLRQSRDDKESIQWAIASASKEIGSVDIGLAMTTLRELLFVSVSARVIEAVQFSQLVLIIREQYREVLEHAASWLVDEDAEITGAYAVNFATLLRFIAENGNTDSDHDPNERKFDVRDELGMYLIRPEDDLDAPIEDAFASLVAHMKDHSIAPERQRFIESITLYSMGLIRPEDDMHSACLQMIQAFMRWLEQAKGNPSVAHRIARMLRSGLHRALQDAVDSCRNLSDDEESEDTHIESLTRTTWLTHRIVGALVRTSSQFADEDIDSEGKELSGTVAGVLFDQDFMNRIYDSLRSLLNADCDSAIASSSSRLLLLSTTRCLAAAFKFDPDNASMNMLADCVAKTIYDQRDQLTATPSLERRKRLNEIESLIYSWGRKPLRENHRFNLSSLVKKKLADMNSMRN